MGDDSFDFNLDLSKSKKQQQWKALREKINNTDFGVNSNQSNQEHGLNMNNMDLNLNKDGTIKLDDKINKMIDDEFDKLASSDF